VTYFKAASQRLPEEKERHLKKCHRASWWLVSCFTFQRSWVRTPARKRSILT